MCKLRKAGFKKNIDHYSHQIRTLALEKKIILKKRKNLQE